jgi:hypothetical protein
LFFKSELKLEAVIEERYSTFDDSTDEEEIRPA